MLGRLLVLWEKIMDVIAVTFIYNVTNFLCEKKKKKILNIAKI